MSQRTSERAQRQFTQIFNDIGTLCQFRVSAGLFNCLIAPIKYRALPGQIHFINAQKLFEKLLFSRIFR